MRVKITGECDAAKVLRNKLPGAGFVLSEKSHDYEIRLDTVQDSDRIVIDGIPCALENHLAYHISKLTPSDISLRRNSGQVFADNCALILLPEGEHFSMAVETGCIRALLELAKPQAQKKTWYQKLLLLKMLCLLLALPVLGQDQSSTGLIPQKVNVTQVNGTPVSAGTGIPVQIVGGGGSGGTSSSFGSPFPSVGTAIGFSNGTNMVAGKVDASGFIEVNCATGCSASAGFPDSSPFTFGTTAVSNFSAVVDDVATNTVAENSAGAVRMNSNRILYVDLSKTSANGTAIKVDASAATVTVAGTVAVSNFPATQTVAGTVSVSNFPATQTVAGTVSVSNFPATQNVDQVGHGTVLSNQQAVTASAVALSTNTCKRACVKALAANTINVYVGPTGVTTATGMELAPGDAVCLPVTNTNLLFVIASTTGASVSWVATN